MPLHYYNTFANAKIGCFGNEGRFPETKVTLWVSGNPLRSIPETTIELAKVLLLQSIFNFVSLL
jgi:hypothetical protein